MTFTHAFWTSARLLTLSPTVSDIRSSHSLVSLVEWVRHFFPNRRVSVSIGDFIRDATRIIYVVLLGSVIDGLNFRLMIINYLPEKIELSVAVKMVVNGKWSCVCTKFESLGLHPQVIVQTNPFLVER